MVFSLNSLLQFVSPISWSNNPNSIDFEPHRSSSILGFSPLRPDPPPSFPTPVSTSIFRFRPRGPSVGPNEAFGVTRSGPGCSGRAVAIFVLGCAEGGCGACTVVVSQYNPTTGNIYHASVNACLAPLVSVDGKHVITVEGIGNSETPHPIQERIAKLHGSQCGFCTPGIVMVCGTLL